jgi:hypothetical protein
MEPQGWLKPVPETTTRERIAASVGGLAMVTSLAAMVVEPSPLVLFAGILNALVLGPFLYYQETHLTDITTLLETKETVQVEMNRLIQSNQELIRNVDDLTTSLDRLQDIEQAWIVVNDTTGTTVEELAKQVEENKQLLQTMKGNLKGIVLQNLLSVIVRSDTNGDLILQEEEVTHLMRRISNISGVRVDQVKFRKACQGKSVHAIMDMVKNLFRPNVADNERIFIFDS